MLEGASNYSILAFGAIGAALFFDFVNGFHDSANAIATVVGTRILKPLYAVIMAAIANFVGPFLFGTAIAATVGNGIIKPEFSTIDIILAGLIGATIWDLITWYFGLPSSSSHALIGGLVGSALTVGGLDSIIIPGIEKVLVFMIVSPIAGFVVAFVLAMTMMYFLKDSKPLIINRVFGKLQIGSSAFFSLTGPMMDKRRWES
jgi:PiT family inorganic phosphate transporter